MFKKRKFKVVVCEMAESCFEQNTISRTGVPGKLLFQLFPVERNDRASKLTNKSVLEILRMPFSSVQT